MGGLPGRPCLDKSPSSGTEAGPAAPPGILAETGRSDRDERASTTLSSEEHGEEEMSSSLSTPIESQKVSLPTTINVYRTPGNQDGRVVRSTSADDDNSVAQDQEPAAFTANDTERLTTEIVISNSPTVTPITRDYFVRRLQECQEEISRLTKERDNLQTELDSAYVEFDRKYDQLVTETKAVPEKQPIEQKDEKQEKVDSNADPDVEAPNMRQKLDRTYDQVVAGAQAITTIVKTRLRQRKCPDDNNTTTLPEKQPDEQLDETQGQVDSIDKSDVKQQDCYQALKNECKALKEENARLSRSNQVYSSRTSSLERSNADLQHRIQVSSALGQHNITLQGQLVDLQYKYNAMVQEYRMLLHNQHLRLREMQEEKKETHAQQAIKQRFPYQSIRKKKPKSPVLSVTNKLRNDAQTSQPTISTKKLCSNAAAFVPASKAEKAPKPQGRERDHGDSSWPKITATISLDSDSMQSPRPALDLDPTAAVFAPLSKVEKSQKREDDHVELPVPFSAKRDSVFRDHLGELLKKKASEASPSKIAATVSLDSESLPSPLSTMDANRSVGRDREGNLHKAGDLDSKPSPHSPLVSHPSVDDGYVGDVDEVEMDSVSTQSQHSQLDESPSLVADSRGDIDENMDVSSESKTIPDEDPSQFLTNKSTTTGLPHLQQASSTPSNKGQAHESHRNLAEANSTELFSLSACQPMDLAEEKQAGDFVPAEGTPNGVDLSAEDFLDENMSLATFLFAHTNHKPENKVSPIFGLFQNADTRSHGRQLLPLVEEFRRTNASLEQVQKQATKLESAIQTEQSCIQRTKESISSVRTKVSWKWNIFAESDDYDATARMTQQERAKKSMEDRNKAKQSSAHEEHMKAKEQLERLQSRLRTSTKALEGYQSELTEVEIIVEIRQARKDGVLAQICGLLSPLYQNQGSSPAEATELAQRLHLVGAELTKQAIEVEELLVPRKKLRQRIDELQDEVNEKRMLVDDAEARLQDLQAWTFTWSEQEMEEAKGEFLLNFVVNQDWRERLIRGKNERARRKREAEDKREAERKKAYEIGQVAQTALEELTLTMNRYLAQLMELEAKLDSQKDVLDESWDFIRTALETPYVQGFDLDNIFFDVNSSKDHHGLNLLMLSVLANDMETVELCLKLGADPNGTSMHVAPVTAAAHFNLWDMVDFLVNHGGRKDGKQDWNGVIQRKPLGSGHFHDWSGTKKIADKAAIPVDDLLGRATQLESSVETRMPDVTEGDGQRLQLTFFDDILVDPNQFADAMRRVVLLEKDVLQWLKSPKTSVLQSANFIDMIISLIPVGTRKRQARRSYPILRRSVVGIKHPYEVLGIDIGGSTLVLFTPFTTSEVDGVFDVGILIWTVVPAENASLYKTLIESTDFLRHKVETDDRFPEHREAIMSLGKDMHLLDLKSTSIYTSRPMDLFVVDVDEELDHLIDDDFVPKKRVLDADKRLAKAIFRTNDVEMNETEDVLSGSRSDMSTQLRGGAGTGKTLLMTKKIIREDPSEEILVVSRLPRLMAAIKAQVGEARDICNITFSTYEDLCSSLAKAAQPIGQKTYQFPYFSRVHYTEFQEFVLHLSDKERKRMKSHRVEAAALWTAIRTIKANIKCIERLEHLSRKEYTNLPEAFGFDKTQRELVYDLFEVYQHWLGVGGRKWDEADRIIFILKFGNRVFSSPHFLSWWDRFLCGDGDGLVNQNGGPLRPFFCDKVFIDEAQDFSELDLALFLRMSKGTRSVFMAADPAQSVEVGLRMRNGTVNDVFHSSIAEGSGVQVKNTLQLLEMRTNHRTHAANLALSKAIRKILTRSFQIPGTCENALINGPKPQAVLLPSFNDMADKCKFRGANIVCLAPDEKVESLKSHFQRIGVRNDLIGIREAKGLEFDAVALLGFFSYVEDRKSSAQWRNLLCWLFSSKGITTTQSSEIIKIGHGGGRKLEPCDYLLSHPDVEDEVMLLYTALTRARNKLYLVEFENDGISRKKGERGLADFAFRCLKHKDLDLVKVINHIDEGHIEMTPQQHKARGVLMVSRAVDFARVSSNTREIRDKFDEARKSFLPSCGDDIALYEQASKHLEAATLKITILEMIKTSFFDSASGTYDLEGKFVDILKLEEMFFDFMNLVAWDTFLFEEFREIACLVEDVVEGTPHAIHLGQHCRSLIEAHETWIGNLHMQKLISET